MNRKFAAIILSHGRPDNVITYNTLKKSGYTGDIVIVLDNEDEKAELYKNNYPDCKFYVFDKKQESMNFDTADLPDAKRNAIVYARNASFRIAKELGYTHFIQLDDDYRVFQYTGGGNNDKKRINIKSLDAVFNVMCEFIDNTNAHTIAMAQGGDFIGGRQQTKKNRITLIRKAMNSFVCRVDREFQFKGRINEDVNTYSGQGNGELILLTTPELMLEQKQTQSNDGGMTDVYKAQGTYVKSFYSVIFNPSCVKIGMMGNTDYRIHHSIDWKCAVPKIIKESHKKI